MKASHWVLGFLLSWPAAGQSSLLEIAGEVRDEGGLEKLVAASFGGGRHYQLAGSPFHIVDLMPTSGIPSTEFFVFESIRGQLALRVHIPRQAFIVMKAEVRDGLLVVSQKPQREGEWEVRLHLVPIASEGGG